ncbi:MAG: ACP S-malonyltransferase [Chloroflexota bacterium]
MPPQIIVSDENCAGHCKAIFHALIRSGFKELLSLELKTIEEVGLYEGVDDETVWRFCQEYRYILVTGNRSMADGTDSLEAVVRELVEPTSIPVLTISDLDRVLTDRSYCESCAYILADYVMRLEDILGVTRLYLSPRET